MIDYVVYRRTTCAVMAMKNIDISKTTKQNNATGTRSGKWVNLKLSYVYSFAHFTHSFTQLLRLLVKDAKSADTSLLRTLC